MGERALQAATAATVGGGAFDGEVAGAEPVPAERLQPELAVRAVRPVRDRSPRAVGPTAGVTPPLDPVQAAAWEELVRRWSGPLERMAAEALARVGERPQPHRVEDLVQEVYCRLLARGGGFDPRRRTGRQVVAYLRRAVRSAAVDGVRAAAAIKRRPAGRRGRDTGAGAVSSAGAPGALSDPVDPTPGPEQRMLARDRRRRFFARCRAAAGRGPRARRDVRLLALTLLYGWTSREIAAASGGRLRPSTIDAAVCRMRRRLAAAGMTLPRRGGLEAQR